LAASCAFGTVGCSDEDEPDNNTTDAATDTPTDRRTDVSVGTDVSSDRNTSDRADTSTTADTRTDTTDGGAPDGGPDGNNCIGGGDAARDGAAGMIAVQLLRCANCHQDEPADAGLILSGKSTTIVADATVFPANLTPDPVTGLGCWTDQQIVTAIMTGVNEKGMMLCSRMPRFSSQIDAGTAQEIVNFLRTIPAVNKPIPETTVCPPRPEPQPDAGSDADGGAPPTEGGTDGTPPADAEGGTPPTDGGTDGTVPPDTASDSTTPDAGTDSAIDVGTDVEIDTGSTDADNDAG
jgi:hypothetical protein